VDTLFVRERRRTRRHPGTKRCERSEPSDTAIAHRRAELGWRAAVLDEQESRHAFRLQAGEEGTGSPGASLCERSEQYIRNERMRCSVCE
jgi:hypothetical protein